MRIVKTPHDYTRELEILASETHSNTFDHCMNAARCIEAKGDFR